MDPKPLTEWCFGVRYPRSGHPERGIHDGEIAKSDRLLAFWERGESATPKVKKELRDAITRFGTRRMPWVFQLLFERLYVMRVQLFHGASTKGSKLNRRALQDSGIILPELLREFLSIMIDRGINEEWGELCFPPDP